MKKMLVYALALAMVVSMSACGASSGGSSSSSQEGGSASSAGSAQLQEPQEPQENPEPERTFRIDTENETVWYEGYSSERTRSLLYQYDPKGHLVQIVPSGSGGGTIKCYDYDEAGNLVREYDSDGIFLTEYTYDDQGRLGCTTEIYDGNVLSVETYAYNSQDQRAMATVEGVYQGDPGSYSTVKVYSYDDQGRLVKEESETISQIEGENESKDFSRTEYVYQDDGNIAESRTYSGENLTSETTYTYDQGRLGTQQTTYEPSGEVEIISFEYDQQGNLIRKVTLRLSQEGAEKSLVTNEYTYTEVES